MLFLGALVESLAVWSQFIFCFFMITGLIIGPLCYPDHHGDDDL